MHEENDLSIFVSTIDGQIMNSNENFKKLMKIDDKSILKYNIFQFVDKK